MFCNTCGSQFPAGSRFCQTCGGVVVENSLPPVYSKTRQHRLQTLGVMWLILGACCFIPFLIFMGFGMHAVEYGPSFWNPITGPIQFFFGVPRALLGIGAFVAGWGLLHREMWARTVGIVVAVLFIFHPPFGTLLAIFTLW